jgi:CRP-like cAMP-binding protein
LVSIVGRRRAALAQLAAAPGSTANEISALYRDLHTMTFRSIVIGVASLAYHRIGDQAGCTRKEALKLMRRIRDKGTVRRRDLQRTFENFSAERLNQVLERLAAEDLLQLDGLHVTAVSLADFVRALHARPEFHEAEYLCPVMLGIEAP